MAHIKIKLDTILITTMLGNPDVQLRQGIDGFYMISPKTGIHFIAGNGELTERVKSHWEGFKKNQNK